MMKGVPNCLVALAFMALACSVASAYDPSPLQDFCVALNSTSTGAVFVNGKFCKDPKLVNANDFFFQGLNIPLSTANPVGTNSTLVNVDLLPGLNTLGISIARVDYAPYGANPPHIHHRATELLLVVEGTLYAGFVTSDPDYRLFTKIITAGDIFVFPLGLIHFQFNVGNTSAVAFASFGSQNPGVIDIPEGVFGSNPPINSDFLAKSFQVDKKVIDALKKPFN